MEIEQVKEIFERIGIGSFKWVFRCINVGVQILIIFGAMASLFLVSKMYLLEFLSLFILMSKTYEILWILIQTAMALTIISGIIYGSLSLFTIIGDFLDDIKIKREKKREKFLNDLTKKIKRKLKKK